MSKIKFDLEGHEELLYELKSLEKLDFAKKVVKKHGARLNQKMVRLAQPGVVYVKGYSTGASKRSISIDFEDEGLTCKVGPNMEYSPYIEYGTRFMEAEPIAKPALMSIESGFIADMRKIDGK